MDRMLIAMLRRVSKEKVNTAYFDEYQTDLIDTLRSYGFVDKNVIGDVAITDAGIKELKEYE